jgi:dTDP-4-dehydrorhamnose reductase
MLGHMVLRHLSREAALMVDGTRRSEPSDALRFDAESGARDLRTLFERRGGYEYIINCIGVTKAGIDEGDPNSIRRAITVNALFPHELAAFAGEAGTRVIHISTDGVFAGTADSYLEDAPHDCTDVYGKTKSLGEVQAPDFLTLRCSIVGPDPVGKKGLLEWFKSQPDGKELPGYTDHLWNGVTTLQFAELCRKIITKDCFQAIWKESPIHHLCPNEPVSKYELLKVFQVVYKRDVSIVPSSGTMAPVRRILRTRYHGIEDLFGHPLGVEQAIRELVDVG